MAFADPEVVYLLSLLGLLLLLALDDVTIENVIGHKPTMIERFLGPTYFLEFSNHDSVEYGLPVSRPRM